MSDCEEALRQLYWFLDGALTDERRGQIDVHLNGCAHCFSAYDFEAELRGIVRNRVHHEAPRSLMARVVQAIEFEALAPNPVAPLDFPSSRGGADLQPPTSPLRTRDNGDLLG